MNRKRTFLTLSIAAGIAIGFIAFMSSRGGRRPRLDDLTARPVIEANDDVQLVNVTFATKLQSAWNRFRGPNGTGVSDDASIPTTWSDDKNLAWKTKLPGYGASSPVLTDEYVFVTSYSGYGEGDKRGDLGRLARQLCCIDRATGEMIWSKSFHNEQREDPYQGMGLPEHGYATNSCTSDGESVFAFLGKSGVHAFDMQGNELWAVSVGTSSGNRGWGSAASLMLYDDLVVVNAAEESSSIIALEKATGQEVWKSNASALELSYATPVIAKVNDNREDLVLAVPGEIWGMNPRTGKLSWFAQTSMTDNLSPGVVVDGETIYAFGGYRSSGSMAFRGGGKGDVTDTNVIWSSRNSSYVATPVLQDGRLYWIDDRGVAFCVNAKDGETVYKTRVSGIDSGGRPVYASPVSIGGKVYVQTRTSGLYVIEPSNKLNVIAQNKFASDLSQFNATPAVGDGQLFLRSNEFLYCVTAKP